MMLEDHENYKMFLPRYYKILDGKAKARFLVTKFLDEKIKQARKILERCELCERRCGVNRKKGEKGFCGVGTEPEISSYFRHMGEEPFFVPSFTIFFIGCNFHCQYCQNWSISQRYEKGFFLEPKELARVIELQRNIRNVNFVGGEPTPNLLYILEVLKHLNRNIPIVWNSNFYMTEKSMDLLDGIVDVYLSDFKYGNDKCAERLSKVKNYFSVVSRNHKLAYKDAELVIRHLVLPNHFDCCAKPVLEWAAENTPKAIVNIMSQYRPQYKAKEYQEINKFLGDEHKRATELADKLGLNYVC